MNLTISNSKISELDTDGVPVQDPEHAVHNNKGSAVSDMVNDPGLAKGNHTHGILWSLVQMVKSVVKRVTRNPHWMGHLWWTLRTWSRLLGSHTHLLSLSQNSHIVEIQSAIRNKMISDETNCLFI